MSDFEQPTLRLLHGGTDDRVDEAFARRIGWQLGDEPPDDFEARLAAQIFAGAEVVSLETRRAPDVHDTRAEDVSETHRSETLHTETLHTETRHKETRRSTRAWLAAVAIVLLTVGGIAASSQLSEPATTQIRPVPEVQPPTPPPDVEERVEAAPAPEPSPRAVPDPGASSPDRLATRRYREVDRERSSANEAAPRVAELRPAELRPAERRPAERRPAELRPAGSREGRDAAREPAISPDGEAQPSPPTVTANWIPPLPTSAAPAMANDPAPAEPPSLRDHLAAAGAEGPTMAVVDVIGAGRHLFGRL